MCSQTNLRILTKDFSNVVQLQAAQTNVMCIAAKNDLLLQILEISMHYKPFVLCAFTMAMYYKRCTLFSEARATKFAEKQSKA